MEADRRRVLGRRKPLSDCTNTCDSSSVSLKPHKPNPSSSALNKSTTSVTANLHNDPNPSSPSPLILHTPSLKTSSSHGSGTVDVEASEPISIVYSRRRSSNKRRRDKGKEVAVPVSSTPVLKMSSSREKSDEIAGEKAKALTVPCRKKQRALSSEDVFKDPLLQDFIEKQKAYFQMIDEFKLSEEEVESSDELD